MFAQIAPLKRLPKSLEICDYKIPETLKGEIHVGQLVTIPFRKSNIFGLVLSLTTSSQFAQKAKEIEDIIHPVPFLKKEEIQHLEQIALLYNVALGPTIEMSLPPLQKRKIKSIELVPFVNEKIVRENKKPIFQGYINTDEQRKILQSFDTNQTLILVPEIHRIQNIFDSLTESQQRNCTIWNSELSEKEKFSRWQKIRNGKVGIVIGTRSTIFLPFFHLAHIVIESEEEKDHKHEDGSPRFHVKDIARLKAPLDGSQITLMSSHPSSETYYNIYKNIYSFSGKENITEKDIGIIALPQKESPSLIDLKTEIIGHKADYFLSTKVQEEIAHSEGDIFLYLNRRGSSTSISCFACGYKDLCPICKLPRVYHEHDKSLHCHYCKTKEAVPLLCPKCQTKILDLRGYGTEQIESTLKKFLDDNTVLIRLDSDMDEKIRISSMQNTQKKIIIGTDIAFSSINWEKITLTVCINLDLFLTIPEFGSEEQLWHTIQKIQYNRPLTSQFFIQTKNPEHAFWKSLSSSDFFYRNDLKKRKDFLYPPYSYLVKYFYGNENKQQSKIEAEQVKIKIENILTKFEKKCMIYDPIELHPHYFRKQYWYGIIVLIEPNYWKDAVTEINAFLSEYWKIDPRPNSLLSP